MTIHCAQCGQPTTKQADNLFVCEQGHQNWINAAPGATVYVIKGDKVLFGTRSINPHMGKLNLPGGFLDAGETAEQAAIREVKEELNIDVELIDILGTYVDTYDGKPTLNIMFIAKYMGGEIKPSEDLSGSEPKWRSIDDLPTRDQVGWDWYMQAQTDLAKWWQSSR